MDLRLPALADANLHLGIAEEALAEGSVLLAQQEADKAREALIDLQELPREGLLQAMLSPLEKRLAALEASLTPVRLQEGSVEVDPEENKEPSEE